MKRAPAKPIQLTAEQIHAVETAVFAAVEPQLPENYYLLDVTFEKEAGYWYLRIYVEGKTQPISLSECETISRSLDTLIDELSILKDLSFSLEISSPGLFRPLRRPREFEFFQGKSVRVEDRPVATKGKKAVIPMRTKAQEGLLQAFDPASSRLTLKNPQTQENFEVTLDDTKMVCLNPVIHFPEEDADNSEAEPNETTES
jgi:ribosome maturation factor RimP